MTMTPRQRALAAALMPPHTNMETGDRALCRGSKREGYAQELPNDGGKWRCLWCGAITDPGTLPPVYFVAPDASETTYLWLEVPGREHRPKPIIARHQLPDDLWAKLTEGMEVRP